MTHLMTDARKALADCLLPKETAEYVSHFGSNCRDCADNSGICPSSGLPCGFGDRLKAIKGVIDAINYGVKHGYLKVSPPLPGTQDREAGAIHAIMLSLEVILGGYPLTKRNDKAREAVAAILALPPAPMPERDGMRETLDKVEAEARRYAEMYKPHSDGRNTFVIFADWVAALAPHDKTEG